MVVTTYLKYYFVSSREKNTVVRIYFHFYYFHLIITATLDTTTLNAPTSKESYKQNFIVKNKQY